MTISTPYQLASNGRKTFEKHTWGGTFHDDFQVQRNDILIAEHWGSSGFANTDLDHQLKQYGIEQNHLHRLAGQYLH
ncbi:isochorismatase family protein [Bradyrhizobium sp. AZCC 2262]|uniref:isochorismatase family protein n=1 Tax=Bradyrhizobium sp. AZCC 2262 TaxID=3117022 RepID=UPI003FA5EF3B